jgi:hypothetical protein
MMPVKITRFLIILVSDAVRHFSLCTVNVAITVHLSLLEAVSSKTEPTRLVLTWYLASRSVVYALNGKDKGKGKGKDPRYRPTSPRGVQERLRLQDF